MHLPKMLQALQQASNGLRAGGSAIDLALALALGGRVVGPALHMTVVVLKERLEHKRVRAEHGTPSRVLERSHMLTADVRTKSAL